jgi:hypothetical protein
MVENQIKNYFDFLSYIGVTMEQTYSKIVQLLHKYNNISNQEIDINNLLSSLTCDYFKSLDKNQLELVGKNIYQQYLINKNLSELKTFKKLVIIRYNFFKRKKKKIFNKWRLMSINSDIPDYLFLNKNNSVKSIKTSRSSSKKNIINSKNFLEKLDFYSEKKRENTDKIKLMIESSLINECTFKPSLNDINKYKRSYSKNNIRKDNNNNYNNSNRKYKTYENDNTQKQLLIELMKKNFNINKLDEKQITNRNNYTPKIKKESKKNNTSIIYNYFHGSKSKTSDKKRKKEFKI